MPKSATRLIHVQDSTLGVSIRWRLVNSSRIRRRIVPTSTERLGSERRQSREHKQVMGRTRAEQTLRTKVSIVETHWRVTPTLLGSSPKTSERQIQSRHCQRLTSTHARTAPFGRMRLPVTSRRTKLVFRKRTRHRLPQLQKFSIRPTRHLRRT